MAGRIATLIFASAAAVVGVILIGIGLIASLSNDHSVARFWASAAAVPGGIMLLELGIAAAWLTLRAARGGDAPAITLPPWWASALTFVVAVSVGWLTLRFAQWWLFLPFATVAVFAPIAATGRLGLPGQGIRPSWRRVLPAFAWGALLTPLLAVTLQLLTAIGALGAAVLGVLASGQEHLDTLQRMLQHLQGRTLNDAQSQALTQLAIQQPVVLAVGAFVLVFAGPVTEELGKFGATILFSRTRPGTPPLPTLTVFLIGLAAGLGFAATENIFYAAQAGPGGWTALILTRGVTPLMHGTASALFALGWARQRREPGGWSLLRGAAAALGLHAAWNLCAGFLIVTLLFVGMGGTVATLAALLMVLAFGTLAALVLGSIVTLLRLRRTLAAEAANLPTHSPWPVRPPSEAPHSSTNQAGQVVVPEQRRPSVGEPVVAPLPVASER